MKHSFLLIALGLLCLASGWFYGYEFDKSVRVGLKNGIVADLYPLWNGTRAVLHGGDPYTREVTEANEVGVYGATSKSLGLTKGQKFVYPIFAAVAVAPLEISNFALANNLAFILFAALMVCSIAWLRGVWDKRTLLFCLFAFGTYPLIFALQSRQPTLLFLGLAIGALALLRRDQPALAGVVAAIAAGKPHVALPIILPMLLWDVRRSRKFAISFSAALAALVLASWSINTDWIAEWVVAMRSYAKTTSGPSVIVSMFGSRAGVLLSAALLLWLATRLWIDRDMDLFSRVALSVVAFQLVLPWEFYNSVVLLIPAVLAFDHAEGMAMTFLKISLAEYWLATMVAAILLRFNPGSSIGWKLPVVMLMPIVFSTAATIYRATICQSTTAQYAG